VEVELQGPRFGAVGIWKGPARFWLAAERFNINIHLVGVTTHMAHNGCRHALRKKRRRLASLQEFTVQKGARCVSRVGLLYLFVDETLGSSRHLEHGAQRDRNGGNDVNIQKFGLH